MFSPHKPHWSSEDPPLTDNPAMSAPPMIDVEESELTPLVVSEKPSSLPSFENFGSPSPPEENPQPEPASEVIPAPTPEPDATLETPPAPTESTPEAPPISPQTNSIPAQPESILVAEPEAIPPPNQFYGTKPQAPAAGEITSSWGVPFTSAPVEQAWPNNTYGQRAEQPQQPYHPVAMPGGSPPAYGSAPGFGQGQFPSQPPTGYPSMQGQNPPQQNQPFYGGAYPPQNPPHNSQFLTPQPPTIKNKTLAAILCLFGALGVHRFYLGRIFTGLLFFLGSLIGGLLVFAVPQYLLLSNSYRYYDNSMALDITAQIGMIQTIGFGVFAVVAVFVLIDFVRILTGNLGAKKPRIQR